MSKPLKSGEYCLRVLTKDLKSTRRIGIVRVTFALGHAQFWRGDRCLIQATNVTVECMVADFMKVTGTLQGTHKFYEWFLFYEDAP